MKKITNPSVLILALNLILSDTARAQEQPVKHKDPSWVPKEGYWVVVSSKQNPKSNEVFFYTNNNQLIYNEQIEGVKMNVNRTRIKKQLKKAFDQAFQMWTANLNMIDQRFIVKLVQ